jgi:hypothetical protein
MISNSSLRSSAPPPASPGAARTILGLPCLCLVWINSLVPQSGDGVADGHLGHTEPSGQLSHRGKRIPHRILLAGIPFHVVAARRGHGDPAITLRGLRPHDPIRRDGSRRRLRHDHQGGVTRPC